MVLRHHQPEPPPVIRPPYPVAQDSFKAFAGQLRDPAGAVGHIVAHPMFPVVALVCGIAFLLWSLDEPSRSLLLAIKTLGSYLCLLVVGAAATILIERKWQWRWTRVAGGVLTVAVVFGWGYFDTYKSQWISGTERFTDLYGQWSGKHLHRRLYHYSSEDACRDDKYEFDYDLESEGPMAGTGKPHGMWTQHPGFKRRAEYMETNQPYTTTLFFWYGEPITEGEWHLRNR